MSSLTQVPASFRYFKARLRVFNRPAVWFASVVMALVLMLAWEYWRNPEALTPLGGDNRETDKEQVADPDGNTDDAEKSPEELAKMGANADIDSSSALLKVLNLENESSTAIALMPELQSPKQEGLFDLLNRKQNEPPASELRPPTTEKPIASNPFAASSEQFLNPLSLSNNNPLAAGNNPKNQSAYSNPFINATWFNPSSANSNATPVNPLQTALLNQNNPANTPQPSTATPLPVSSVVSELNNYNYSNYSGQQVVGTPYSAGNNLPYNQNSGVPYKQSYIAYPNSYTYINPPQVGGTYPTTQGTPSMGTINQFGNQQTGTINNGFTNTQINQATNSAQYNQTQPNFTVPRTTPGRYIGGGQINTFANP